jgi:glycosyltransferase involved in cell wall biosynthesis
MRVPLIIDAFRLAREISDQLREHRLLVAGDGPLRADLRDVDDKQVQIVGELGTADLHAVLRQSQAFVSVPRTDGTSASLLEGMAAGAIPIVNDLPANRQWVTPEAGVLVRRNPSADELAAAIVQALERPPDRANVRASVAAAVWEPQVHELISLYARVSRR